MRRKEVYLALTKRALELGLPEILDDDVERVFRLAEVCDMSIEEATEVVVSELLDELIDFYEEA